MPDFYLPQLDCYVEIKGQEPTTDERTKAKLLALHTAKRVYTFYGDLWLPEKPESYHGMCDEPPRIGAWKEDSPYKELAMNLPHALIDASAQLDHENIELFVGEQNIGLVSHIGGVLEATLSGNLQSYLAHLQKQQDVVRKVQPVLLQHEQVLQQMMSVGESYRVTLFPYQQRENVVWSECQQCGKVQPSEIEGHCIRYHTATGEQRQGRLAPRPIGPWCRCHAGLPTYTTQSPRLVAAYTAARQARFEHARTGAPSSHKAIPWNAQEPLISRSVENGLEHPAQERSPDVSSESLSHPFPGQRILPQQRSVSMTVSNFTLTEILKPNLIAEMTFSTFKPQVRGSAKPCRAAMDFAANPQGWLVLSGSPGCGKTHLAMAIAHQCRSAGHQVLYFSEPDFLDYLRASFHDTASYRFDDLFPRIQQGKILVLDDMGIQRQTTWVKEIREKLFTYRFDQKLPTVLVFGAHQDLQGVLQLQQLESTIHLVKMEGVTDYRLRQDRRPTKDRPTS